MCGSRIFAGPPIYHIRGITLYLRLLVYINLQPEYELSSSTRFGQFQKFGKFQLGYCPPQLLLRKICMGCEFLFKSNVAIFGYFTCV